MVKADPVFKSEVMHDLYRQAALAARTSVPILITGETGTGKEVLARYIHSQSEARGMFVPIDCSAFPEHLVESELFGHLRGAFTGATSDRKGLLELAANGTAFLDEIGELPIHLQAKLLRVLDSYQIRPVGSSAFRDVSFRIIAATNRDLSALTREGKFREDLLYRLGALQLHIPPLRERPEDIPALVELFWGDCSGDRPPKRALDLLSRYDWPGNVRQLQHCVRCMAELRRCPLLDATTKSSSCRIARSLSGVDAPVPAAVELCSETGASAASVPTDMSLATIEKTAIREALERTNGRRAEAAELLGLARTTFYRKVRAYGLAVEGRRSGVQAKLGRVS